MPVRHDHQMAVVVRKLVENDVGGMSAVNDQRIALAAGGHVTENAGGLLGAAGLGHVGKSPGGPEAVHRGRQSRAGYASASVLSRSVSSTAWLIRSFNSLPGLKYGTFFGGTSTRSPV